jgi:hypothetical protein
MQAMKKLFYLGFFGLLLFEAANVYFIMPMPGSQRMNSIDLAYFLYNWRWLFRAVFTLLLLVGLFKTIPIAVGRKRRWTFSIPLILLAVVIYVANFKMAADAMFKQPDSIVLATSNTNMVDSNRLVIGVVNNGAAKAYPIRFLGYHHFVYDTINGKDILVTYCTVCRTGRVFEPLINGKKEQFRLVGMDHFNAMLEDATTKSWWRQSTGEAIAGKLKGIKLNEVLSTQTTLAQWIQLYPASLIMQADKNSAEKYDTTYNYEDGKSKSKLTGTDSLSWKNKSWVIGVKLDNSYKAFDWNELKQKRILQSKVGNSNAFVILAPDGKSFFAYGNPFNTNVNFENDTIKLAGKIYKLNGQGIDTAFNLKPVKAYQEFWHSWQTFHPNTIR